MEFHKINYLMSIAYDEAYEASIEDEVPVGAVITNSHGDIIAKAHNTKEKNQFVCDHAEVLAIKEASKALESWRLNDCSLFVTLEPCPMCMSAIQQSRIKNVYFGAYDQKGGAISLGFNIHQNPALNHNVNIFGGFRHIQCSKMISNFFKQKRRRYKK